MFIIYANNKAYTVSEHAVRRMVERDIPELWVVETLEEGAVSTQGHGIDLYEHQIEDAMYNQIIIVQVVVNEGQRIIISVIDDTEQTDS